MPYIPETRRFDIDEAIMRLPVNAMGPGEYNYAIIKMLLDSNPRHYTDFNNLIGVLECVKLELYRRMIVPYEDKKKELNGDVFLKGGNVYESKIT